MRLLLDTHIYIWCVDNDPKLSGVAWSMILAAEAVFVSSASIWEAAIKHQLGKLAVDPDRLAAAVEPSGFVGLPISLRHAAAVRRLPALHRDPFDRMLLAQAISEPLHLLTADGALSAFTPLVRIV